MAYTSGGAREGMPERTIAFVCEGNAGRSQLATALAKRERDRRGLDWEVVTGGIDPAEEIHGTVIEALAEEGIDVSDRTPRGIRPEDVADADHVVTMGCDVAAFTPPGWAGEAERWELEHPHAGDLEAAREQRDELEARVGELFDRLEG